MTAPSQTAAQQSRRGRPPGRALLWFALGTLVVYAAGVVIFWPPEGEKPNEVVFVVLMFAPTAGALLARFAAGGRIQWGRPGWWLLAGLVPAVAVLAVDQLAVAAGWLGEDGSVLRAAAVGAPLAILAASFQAVGEEIGWRGFLWPTLRDHWGFGRTALVLAVVWWAYHVALVLVGWYGSISGLPAFTVALVGFTLFVGVLTDRSASLWPSTVAHGAWNALVATSFAGLVSGVSTPALTGSDELLGEFGWLAAVTVLVVGAAAAAWHVRTGAPRRARPTPVTAASSTSGRAEDRHPVGGAGEDDVEHPHAAR